MRLPWFGDGYREGVLLENRMAEDRWGREVVRGKGGIRLEGGATIPFPRPLAGSGLERWMDDEGRPA